MKLENQLVSLELAKKMKELGFPKNAYWTWYTNGENKHLLHHEDGLRSMECKTFDAYAVAELAHILPKKSSGYLLHIQAVGDKWGIGYGRLEFKGDKLADLMAKMLIYLAENNLINPKQQ